MTKVTTKSTSSLFSTTLLLLSSSLLVFAIWYRNSGHGSSMDLSSKQENAVVLPPVYFLYQQASLYSPDIKYNIARRANQVASVVCGVFAFASVIYGIYGAIYGQMRTLSCLVSVVAFTAAMRLALMKRKKALIDKKVL